MFFFFAAVAAVLALISFIVDYASPATSRPDSALAIVAVAVNGTPIFWGAVKGLINREVNVEQPVSLAIIASLIQGEYVTAAVANRDKILI